MTTEQQALWEKINNFEIDEISSSLTFTDRLARENGWSIEYSVRAIYEYKRFIFMLCVTDHSLTPSDQVDQVWHLHLLYTQSYWIGLCQNTIGRQIHHGPTKGGQAEGEKYGDLYERTLKVYQELFLHPPPADLWPAKEIRFSDVHFQRINLNKNWIVKKPSLFSK